MANAAVSWPSAISRSRTSRGDVRLGAADQAPGAICATTRSAACAATTQEVDLVVILDHPQLPQHGRGDAHVRPIEAGSAAIAPWIANRWLAHNVSDTATPRGHVGRCPA